nr:unnamed protein product [Callosobruchus chinensis]
MGNLDIHILRKSHQESDKNVSRKIVRSQR